MSKPHICFVSESEATYSLLVGNSSERMGGAELQLVLLASALQDLGYRITFLVADWGQADKIVTDKGITILKGRPPSGQSGLFSYVMGLRRLWKVLRASDADIYLHMCSAAVVGVIGFFCKLNGKPFVFSVAHDLDISGRIGLYIHPRFRWMYAYGLNAASAIVVQTERQATMLTENLRREGELISSTFTPPKDSECDKSKSYALWVGSFRMVKRPEMFLDLARKLPQFKFIMVGGPAVGEEQLYDIIRERAEGIANLTITGPVPYEETGRYFGEASVFVNTSSSEGFPNTYLQSWCRGTPVISTFDVDDLIERHGLGRKCVDIDELASAVSEFMTDASLRETAGNKGIEYVNEVCRPEKVAAKYDALFTSLHG